jgi:hypothetical protein
MSDVLQEQVANLNNKLLLERQLRIAETARKVFEEQNGQFKIRLRIPTGKLIINAFNEEELEYKENEFDTKTYYYNKLSANDNNLLTSKRGELANTQDAAKAADLTNRIYEFLALKFLRIKHDDYIRAEWDDIRLAIDVCNHINDSGHLELEVKPEDKKVKLIKNKLSLEDTSPKPTPALTK